MNASVCVLLFGFLALLAATEARKRQPSSPAYDEWFTNSMENQQEDIGWFKSFWRNLLSKLGLRNLDAQTLSKYDRPYSMSGRRPWSPRVGILRRTETGDKVTPLTECSSKRDPPSPYTTLRLALTWTPGQCYQNKYCGKNLTDTFALHGLWPTKPGPSGPNCCTDNVDFFDGIVSYGGKDTKYFNAVQTIVKKRMVSLYSASSSSISLFQKHEWTKHGTCAVGSNPALNDPIPYFEKMMELDRKIGGENILANAGIRWQADIPVELSKIENAVKSRVNNVNIQLRCRQFAGTQGGTVYLMHEIRVCFDPIANTPVNCPNMPNKSKCGNDVYLKFSR